MYEKYTKVSLLLALHIWWQGCETVGGQFVCRLIDNIARVRINNVVNDHGFIVADFSEYFVVVTESIKDFDLDLKYAMNNIQNIIKRPMGNGIQTLGQRNNVIPCIPVYV